MFENKEKTNLNALGEFGLINHLTSGFENTNAESLIGIGDDAAVIKNNEHTVISTDQYIENVHFDVVYTPLKHLGFKVVAATISDLCAMNATPKQILISVGVSSKYTLEALEDLYNGIKAACDAYNVDLVGGDTSSSVQGLYISATALGEVSEQDVVKRTGAQPGELVCVTGDLGGAYLGLQILEREKQVFLAAKDMQPDLESKDYIIGRQLKPEARVDIKPLFKELEIKPSSMIDISDGLSSELFHLSKNSNVGVAIHEDKLPIDQQTFDTARELNLDPTTCVLSGGEDYELLFTLPQKYYEKIKNSPDITIIGYVTPIEQGQVLINTEGSSIELKAQGWQHIA